MANPEVVQALQQAALAIYDERRKLNAAFEQIEKTVQLFMPGVKLLDDGTLIDSTQPVGEQIVKPPLLDVELGDDYTPPTPASSDHQPPGPGAVAVVEAQRAERDAGLAEQHSEAETRRVTALANDKRELYQRLSKYIFEHSPARPSKIDHTFLNSTLPNGTVVTLKMQSEVINELRTAKVIKRETDGRFVHREWSPKVAALPDSGQGRGSGTRQDTLPKPVPKAAAPSPEPSSPPVDPKSLLQHAYTEGDTMALCGYIGPKADNAQERCPDCAAIVRRDNISEAGPKDATLSADDNRGLAQSPIPRSQMRPQQRLAEERLDALVAWIADQGDIFDAATAGHELGYENGGLFTNKHQSKQYFDVLEERKIIERTGDWYHPPYKDNLKAKGRTSPIWKRGAKFPKADPAEPKQSAQRVVPVPPTQASGSGESTPGTSVPAAAIQSPPGVFSPLTEERVRDAAIAIGNPTVNDIILRCEAVNTRVTRALVKEYMAGFVRKGMFKDVSTIGLDWLYIEPTEEGAAARMDRERRPQAPTAATVQAVSGTGRGSVLRSGRAEVNRLIKAIQDQWGADKVRKQGNNHFAATAPDGSTIRFASTPSQRSMLGDFRKFRNAGLVF